MKRMKRIAAVLMAAAALALCACAGQPAGQTGQPEVQKDIGELTVLIDPGHGDTDVGTIGPKTGRYEKEVNLQIALKLKAALEERGVTVMMTRESDAPLGDPNETDTAVRKEQDMQAREALIDGAGADLLISIHQNAFDDASVAGPQVFYLHSENDGKDYGVEFAKTLQTALNEDLDVPNPRHVGSGNWRLLKKGSQPGAIVECGFFTNPEEEQLLQQDEYQNKIVTAIVHGVEEYMGG